MTVQHLGPLHEAERTDNHLYQESSSLLHSDAAASFTRGFFINKPPLEPRESNTVQFSLWLMPPPSVTQTLEEQISFYSNTSGGPSFDPHVTVVGGIAFDSIDDAKKFANLLHDELAGFGEIDAVFQPKARNFDVWSQALVVEMEASPKFINLCQTVRRILNMDTTSLFPPPVNGPHLSLFYGVDNVPNADDVQPVPNFSSNTLTLWKTDPATVEGVPQWEFFDEISLA